MLTYAESSKLYRQLNDVLGDLITIGSYMDHRNRNSQPFYFDGEQSVRYSAYVENQSIAQAVARILNRAFNEDPDTAGRMYAQSWHQLSGTNAGKSKVEVYAW